MGFHRNPQSCFFNNLGTEKKLKKIVLKLAYSHRKNNSIRGCFEEELHHRSRISKGLPLKEDCSQKKGPKSLLSYSRILLPTKIRNIFYVKQHQNGKRGFQTSFSQSSSATIKDPKRGCFEEELYHQK